MWREGRKGKERKEKRIKEGGGSGRWRGKIRNWKVGKEAEA